MKIQRLMTLTAFLALVPTVLFAQMSSTPTTTKKPSMMQKLGMMFHKKSSSTRPSYGTTGSAGTMSIAPGNIVGDKKTKVFHMPGDTHLPNINNRVYFKSATAAQAAGYRMAGSGKSAKMSTMSHRKTKK